MRAALIGVAALLALAALTARAEPAPADKEPAPIIKAYYVDADVFLTGRFVWERQKTPDVSFRERWMLLEEGGELHSKGYVIDPNIMEWKMDLLLGAGQERFASNEAIDEGARDAAIGGYTISGLFYKNAPVSVRAFAEDNTSNRDRDFARSIRYRQARQGAEAVTKGDFPVSLLVEWIQTRETSDLRDVDSHTAHYRATVTDARNPDWLTQLTFDHRDQNMTAEYTPMATGQEMSQDLPDRSNEAVVSNQWRFGPGEDKSSLVGQARLLDRDGAFNNDIVSFQERLELVHDKTLRSFYQGSWERNKTDFDTQTTTYGEAGLTKRFYDNLTVTARLSDVDQQYDSGSENILRGAARIDYFRHLPVGLYTTSLDLAMERRREENPTGVRDVSREVVNLPSSYAWVRLPRPNVLTGTLLVEDSVTLAFYFENVHYEVRTTGAFTEIRRKPLAVDPIPDDRPVLVSYRALVGRDDVVRRGEVLWANRLQLEKLPLAFYANAGRREEALVSGDNPGDLDSQRSFLAGVEFDHAGFLVAFEHEVRGQQLTPDWRANRLRAGYRTSLARNLDVSVMGLLERLTYVDGQDFDLGPGQDHLDTLGGTVTLTGRLNRRTTLRFSTDARRTEGRENLAIIRNALGVCWEYDKLDFSLEARYDWLDQDFTSGDAVSLMFTLRRRF
ncbi:MAG: hypothetical protein NT031_15925 [Planctomycetota bacterium]|nr:hypothetical protein [Planctomycetota bacterium]